MNENFQLVNAEYVSIFGINLPKFNPDLILSAELYVCKNTNTTDLKRNPNIYLNKVTSNINYESITGTSYYSSSYITAGLGNQQSYTFDILDEVTSSLENNEELILTLEGNTNGYASFYSSESSSSFVPYISIVVNNDILGATFYGNAPTYREETSHQVNCLAYSLLLSSSVDLYLQNFGDRHLLYSTVYNIIESRLLNYDYNVREIDSYDSPIYSYERRIAFRYDLSNSLCWHFVMQNSDGSWSAKLGAEGDCGQYPISITPENDSMWDMYNGLIDEETHYYAIMAV